MRRVKQVVNFIALGLFFDHLIGTERPKEWLDGDLWIWQKPKTQAEG